MDLNYQGKLFQGKIFISQEWEERRGFKKTRKQICRHFLSETLCETGLVIGAGSRMGDVI